MEKFDYSTDHPSLKDASRDEHSCRVPRAFPSYANYYSDNNNKVGPGGANNCDSQFFSLFSRSIFPNRYPGELEYDSKNNATIHRVMQTSEIEDWMSHLKLDLMLNGKEHEEYIWQLRKHLADCSIEEAQVLDEEYTLDKHIAYMRMVPHGTVCLFIILRTGIIIAVESRLTLGINVKKVISNNELKFRRVGNQNPPVIVAVAGNKDRCDFLLRELEKDQGENSIEAISDRCKEILGDAPKLKEHKCYLLLAGYSEMRNSFLVLCAGDTKKPKDYDSLFDMGAIGSGAKFALPKLTEFYDKWRDRPEADPEEIYHSAVEKVWAATTDAMYDDPACGGTIRMIWITEAWCTPPKDYHPIQMMCYLKPNLDNSLFFFTRSSHDDMNYGKLEWLLIAGRWLPCIRGRDERPPPACLGVAGDATVFLVRFEEKGYAYDFFRKCEIVPSFDADDHPFQSSLHLRKVVYGDQELLVCVKEFGLLEKIVNGSIKLPW